MNKKSYIIPSVFVYQLRNSENLLQSISGGGDDNGDGTGDAKRATYLIDDDDDLFSSRSTSFSEAEVYSPFDL